MCPLSKTQLQTFNFQEPVIIMGFLQIALLDFDVSVSVNLII